MTNLLALVTRAVSAILGYDVCSSSYEEMADRIEEGQPAKGIDFLRFAGGDYRLIKRLSGGVRLTFLLMVCNFVLIVEEATLDPFKYRRLVTMCWRPDDRRTASVEDKQVIMTHPQLQEILEALSPIFAGAPELLERLIVSPSATELVQRLRAQLAAAA